MAAGRASGMTNRCGLLLLAVSCVLAFLAGCTKPVSQAETKLPVGAVQLTGAGATFPSVLYNRWFAVYHEGHPNTFINYSPVGSGEGIRRFVGKNLAEGESVDFGASDAAMQDADLAQVESGALMLPVTAGCVVLAYNLPSLHGELKLSRRAYAGIFLGEIKNWNDPRIKASNPGLKLPNLTIVTAVRQDGSGTTFAFTRNLDAISEQWRGQFGPATLVDWPGEAMRARGNEGVAGLIEKSVGSIGYVGYEFARRIGLDMAALENKDGTYVSPSAESCGAGLAVAASDIPDNLRLFVPDPAGANSYPIVTLSWILLRKNYQNPQLAGSLRELFRWCLQDGQRYAPELGYVAVPVPIVEKALTALDKIAPGG